MAEPKLNATDAGVKAFMAAVTDPKRKADCQALIKLMKGVTSAEPVLWGASIVGFGAHTYRLPSGRAVDKFVVGFSPRKKDLSLYVMPSLSGFGDLLTKLGPHRCGKACLYVNTLDDVNPKVLKELLARAVKLANGG